ncbi:MAG: methylmalonyl Co-A mutase-associated GTPase MeaB [Pseudomonadota bacterium]
MHYPQVIETTRELFEEASRGDRRSLARLISAAERGEALPGMPLAFQDDENCLCIGITGAPGAGKSTLVSALTQELLKTEPCAAVLAIDPTSPVSRGALLGDRVRMQTHSMAQNVFIRSMATRHHHGGLALATQSARRLLQHCGWPLVIVETVGVGQVELDVVKTADVIVVVLNPGWGDEIQANKAGLMEVADVFVINKADRPGLESTRRDLEAVLLNRPADNRPIIVETVASKGLGIAELARALANVRRQLNYNGALATRRIEQLALELEQQVERHLQAALKTVRHSKMFEDSLQRVAHGQDSVAAAASQITGQVLSRPPEHGNR